MPEGDITEHRREGVGELGVLERVVRVGLVEKMTRKQKLYRGEETSHTVIGGPEVEAGLTCLKNIKEVKAGTTECARKRIGESRSERSRSSILGLTLVLYDFQLLL